MNPELAAAYERETGFPVPPVYLHPGFGDRGGYVLGGPREDSIILGPDANDYVFAHELGHSETSRRPGLMQQVQDKTYNFGDHPLIKIGAQAAIGAFAPTNRRAIALSLGTAYLSQAGKLASEAVANRNADKYLQSAGIPQNEAMRISKLKNQFGYGAGPAITGLATMGVARTLASAL